MKMPPHRRVEITTIALGVLCTTLVIVGILLRPQLGPWLLAVIALGGLILNGRKDSLDRKRFSVERFKAPIEHLNDDSSGLRLGGVHELNHITAFSDTDQNTAAALLCGFLQIWTAHGEGRNPTTGLLSIEVIAAIESIRSRRRLTTDKPLNLAGVHIPGANLHAAYLPDATLSLADITSADLREATLTDADLTGAILTKANLTEADLHGARLGDARLPGTDLTRANLRGADLTDVILVDTILDGADLRDTIGLTPLQLTHARTDAKTLLPWPNQ